MGVTKFRVGFTKNGQLKKSWPSASRCLVLVSVAITLFSARVHAMDFMEKRECLIDHHNNHVQVHTTCLIEGGIQGGYIDISAIIPDGTKYLIWDPGPDYPNQPSTLNGRKAQKLPDNIYEMGCYNIPALTICFGNKVD